MCPVILLWSSQYSAASSWSGACWLCQPSAPAQYGLAAGNFSSFLFQLLPRVAVYPPSGVNQNFQYCGHNFASLPNGIGFGGQVRDCVTLYGGYTVGHAMVIWHQRVPLCVCCTHIGPKSPAQFTCQQQCVLLSEPKSRFTFCSMPVHVSFGWLSSCLLGRSATGVCLWMALLRRACPTRERHTPTQILSRLIPALRSVMRACGPATVAAGLLYPACCSFTC